MTDMGGQIAAAGSGEAEQGVQPLDARLWVQAHRAAAQAAVATALGARVVSLELQDEPPAGVVRLAEPNADHDGPPGHSRVRMLAYQVAGPIAERVAGVGGVSLQGEPAYFLATTVLDQMRAPAEIDEETDTGAVARLLLDHFGDRVDDAAEAAEHLALNVEAWVSEHWGAIAVVALHLLRYRSLTGDGVRRLMPPMEAGSLG